MEELKKIETTLEAMIKEQTNKAIKAFTRGDTREANRHSKAAINLAKALGAIKATIIDDFDGF